jgi:ATP-dependent exoDNAse (exonuclease V) alpha subunit
MTQKEALEILELGSNVYLTGEAGSGKTYLLNKFISFLRKYKTEVAITASTGIAATHLGGVTIDSWSGLGMRDDVSQSEIISISKNHHLQKRIKKTKVLIIDEVSMIHGRRLDSMDRIFKITRGNNLPFGGIQIILCGDFFQLPPVSDNRSNFDYVYKSKIWKEMNPHILYLESQYRQTDPVFNEVLSAIRNNKVDENIKRILIQTATQEFKGSIIPTKLYTHNIDVDAINKQQLDMIGSKPYEYMMVSVGHESLVNALKRGCLAPENLILKKGAQVMFVRNNYKAGYFNGTIGRVINFDKNQNPIVETYEKNKITVEKTSWNIMEDNKISAEIIQYPLRLAWAITVHKSQGMTLSVAEIDLSKSFVHGMGYVALSRVKSLKGVKLLGMNETALKVDPEIIEFDKILREKSTQEINNLDRTSWLSKFFGKRKYIYYLTS